MTFHENVKEMVDLLDEMHAPVKQKWPQMKAYKPINIVTYTHPSNVKWYRNALKDSANFQHQRTYINHNIKQRLLRMMWNADHLDGSIKRLQGNYHQRWHASLKDITNHLIEQTKGSTPQEFAMYTKFWNTYGTAEILRTLRPNQADKSKGTNSVHGNP